MSFINFFWRDFKSDRAFNWFYILCASLGIVGLLMVESFKGGIEDKVSKNAKNFIASDLSISSRRSLDPKEIQAIEDYLAKNKLSFARWIETYSLVSRAGGLEPLSKLADLNFVSEEFPYFGGVVLENSGFRGAGKWIGLHTAPHAWISRDLSWELGVKLGDKLKIGEMEFTIDGVITEDKFSSFRGFSLAPKIFLSYNYLTKTDLIKFGSTATYAYAIKLKPDDNLKKIQAELRTLLPDKSIKIVGPEESSQQIARSLNILSDYLALITLMTYLLSLVGLYYFTQHFLSKKLKTFSIYKSLGLKTTFLFKVSFVHLIVLTITAVIISTSAVVLTLPLLESFFTNLIGDVLLFRLGSLSLIRILLLSLGGSMLALGPLFWGALQTPVATIFQDLPAELKRIRFYYFMPLLIYIIILTIFLSNSFKVGGYFLGSLTVIIILAGLCFKFFTLALEKLAEHLSFVNRHAAKTMSRYFTSSFTIFICLLIGMTLTTFIFQLDSSLRNEFTQTYGDRRPDLFMFDLQDSQSEKYDKLVKNEKWHQTLFAPMIRGRLIKINQELTQKRVEPGEGEFSTREDQSSERMRNRGVNLSYRTKLSWSESVVEGSYNGERCHVGVNPCGISLEQSYAKRLGVKLGDLLFFDVSGIEVVGIVTSLRKVKWISFEPNFFILFQPGVLEEAPKTFLSSFKVKTLGEKREIFAKIAEQFPNVSILDVSEVIKKITTVFDLMALAIKFISLLSLFVALVVLVAVSFNHLDLRSREMTLYHMLGLKLIHIKKIYTREFSFLILLCIILSLVFGSALTMILMRFIFDSDAKLIFSFVASVMVALGLFLYIIVSARVRYLVKRKSLF
ncbi:MAG: ABC transporter permease [Bacteriovorax sp.]|nr:ABC transporter permease [Bacteriovorax sp.]